MHLSQSVKFKCKSTAPNVHCTLLMLTKNQLLISVYTVQYIYAKLLIMEHSIYQIILQNLHKNRNFCDSDSVAITLSSAAAAKCTVQYYSSTVMVITAEPGIWLV